MRHTAWRAGCDFLIISPIVGTAPAAQATPHDELKYHRQVQIALQALKLLTMDESPKYCKISVRARFVADCNLMQAIT